MSNAKLASAVADAVTAAQADGQAAKDADAAKDGTAGVTPPEATDDAAKADSDTSSEVSSDVDTKDVPDTLFGVDLSVLPDDETRAKFVREFTETNKTINKLQREVAEKKVEEPTPPAAPQATEPAAVDVSKLTDEQIAQAMGFDPENLDERDLREVALTRSLLEQQDRLERLEQGAAEGARTSTWERSFDGLERDYGKLPDGMTREDVYTWAKAQGITDPTAAYWAAVGPVRATVTQALSQRLVELKTTDKKQATTPRPTGNVPTTAKLEAKTVKDAVREAFTKAKAELGVEGYD